MEDSCRAPGVKRRNFWCLLVIFLFFQPWVLCFPESVMAANELPPYPMAERRQTSRDGTGEKAWKLFLLVKKENRRLQWDECLGEQAYRRARWLVENGYFGHKDPVSGKNPAWDMVWECGKWSCVGENLATGYVSAEETHRGLMNSPSHRKNILNRRYTLVGIGCYSRICVQLFAGR